MAWTDSGMDWTVDRTGDYTAWEYYNALMHALVERTGLYSGWGSSAFTHAKRGAPFMPMSGYEGVPVQANLLLMARYINYNWFNSESSSQWIDRRTLDYDTINGTPYADLTITKWTRTAMRAYLEDGYGYGDLWDRIMSVTESRTDITKYRRIFGPLSWRWMHFFYVLLNLLTVKQGYTAYHSNKYGRYGESGSSYTAAVNDYNGKTVGVIGYGIQHLSAGHHVTNYDEVTGDAGDWVIVRSSRKMCSRPDYSTSCPNESSVDWPHLIKHVSIAKVEDDDYMTYENNDFAGVEGDAWIAENVDEAKAVHVHLSPLLHDLEDGITMVRPDGIPGVIWRAPYTHIAIIDAGITGGFAYQDDTV